MEKGPEIQNSEKGEEIKLKSIENSIKRWKTVNPSLKVSPACADSIKIQIIKIYLSYQELISDTISSKGSRAGE